MLMRLIQRVIPRHILIHDLSPKSRQSLTKLFIVEDDVIEVSFKLIEGFSDDVFASCFLDPLLP